MTKERLDLPKDWAERREKHLDHAYWQQGELRREFDRAGTDDRLMVGTAPPDLDNEFHIEWVQDAGLAHAHTADSLKEAIGVTTAMAYMIPVIENDRDRGFERGYEDAIEEMEARIDEFESKLREEITGELRDSASAGRD